MSTRNHHDVADNVENGSEVLTLAISGMRCDNCAASIAKRLDALRGVREARVSYALEDARIRFDPTLLSAESLIGEIEEAGYHASPRSTSGSAACMSRSGPIKLVASNSSTISERSSSSEPNATTPEALMTPSS